MTIFLITAPSGSGKTTLANELKSRGLWEECISTTTRDMRKGERDGVTYYFVNFDTFKLMKDNDEFAETVAYDNNLYGITHSEIKDTLYGDNNIYIIVEYDGYKQIKELYPEAVGIFLYMTKEDCMANMLLRGDSIEKALDRINKYDDEMSDRNEFDYVVRNVRGSFDETVDVLIGITRQYE